MIKCEDNKKECVIVGKEEDILYEFSVICYGLLKADFEIDQIVAGLKCAYEKFNEDKKEKVKNENIKNDIL